jgi:LPXTG-site transpeptidase (sortase) family protein
MKKVKNSILLLILLGIIIIISHFIYINYSKTNEELLINDYFEKRNNNSSIIIKNNPYNMILNIPRLNFIKGLCPKSSKCNNINKNITILNDSDYPNKQKGRVIIAGHSGTGLLAYFNNLNKLQINDQIYLYYANNKYIYHVSNIYEIDKTGKLNILDDKHSSSLILITCKINSNKQIIIICQGNN